VLPVPFTKTCGPASTNCPAERMFRNATLSEVGMFAGAAPGASLLSARSRATFWVDLYNYLFLLYFLTRYTHLADCV
jgi:hypothetical protein